MNWRLSASLFLLTCCAACADRARVNARCEWIARPQANLDDDALFAEDLAIRYADTRRGHRSGHYAGVAEYGQAREQCMARLFDAVARDHRVTVAQVHDALGHRSTLFDSGAIVSFFVIYGLATTLVAGWISRHFSFQHTWAAVLATLAALVPVSVAGWMSGGLWFATLEMIRIGNDHMSYRGERAPWNHHQAAVFAACVVIGWLATIMSTRRRKH